MQWTPQCTKFPCKFESNRAQPQQITALRHSKFNRYARTMSHYRVCPSVECVWRFNRDTFTACVTRSQSIPANNRLFHCDSVYNARAVLICFSLYIAFMFEWFTSVASFALKLAMQFLLIIIFTYWPKRFFLLGSALFHALALIAMCVELDCLTNDHKTNSISCI